MLRFLLLVIVAAFVGAYLMGYVGNRPYSLTTTPRGDASDAVARARERGAEIAGQAAAATAKVEDKVNEATLTTKIKAKMALDDSVKARSINVTTNGTTVTLSGTVESRAEHDRAMSLARETSGVTQVIDDLRIQ